MHLSKNSPRALFQSAVLRHCQGRHQLSVKRLNDDEGALFGLFNSPKDSPCFFGGVSDAIAFVVL
ncbi:hypothetical protein C0145_01350 [Moraxella catarrhalis]|nr:hypothetical protein [Moraxella catarrhalis]MPX44175.1 hypothetical protein [Moraxella catarrhalis]MPX53964.1 hypothetical protein [Moraxella catarrhalis]RKM30884.1 hypothetical protein D6D86_08270 [Moraxella catarrhalis]